MARKATTWSVKGIEEDVRDIARAAADRDEQTIGAWIDHAIRVHGGQRPRDDGAEGGGREGGKAAEPDAPADPLPAAGESAAPPAKADIGALLDIIDGELDASSRRLDTALRPMGLALLDLAERMVALERSAPAAAGEQARIGHLPAEEGSGDDYGAEPETAYDDDFGPEAPPEPEDFDLPEAPEPITAAPDDPPPPLHDLESGLDRLDMPLVGVAETGGSERAREIDRRLRALAGAVDAADTDPAPPTHDLGPSSFDLETPPNQPAPAETLDLPKAFQGVQQRGYESHPGYEAKEAARAYRDARRRRTRRLLLAASVVPIMIAGGLYAAADRIGLGHVRAEIDRNVRPAIATTLTGVEHLLERAGGQLAPLKEELEVLLFGAEKQPEPARQVRADTAPATAEPEPRSVPDVLGSERQEQASEPAAESTATSSDTAAPEPAAERPDAGIVPAQDEAPAVPSEPQSEEPQPARPAPASQSPAEIAAVPEDSEPVPVPNAAPAEAVTEVAPPPAPALPAAPPQTGNTAGPADGQVAALPPSGAPARGSARELLLQRAEAGDATAQHDLAILYLTGKGGPTDAARAAELLREAAIQGLASAQYNLAVLYETGQGVRKDDVRALLWYHSAAEQGHPNAQYNLGVMYAEGRGIPLNFEEAARWFRAAANQGLARALYNLAVMTDEGLGVAPDKAAALELYRAAAGAGDERAIELLAGSGEGGAEAGKPLSGAEGVQTTTATPASLVADIQAELARLGHYEGRLDGLMGPKTRTAIRSFQAAESLTETGEASPDLLKRLKAVTP